MVELGSILRLTKGKKPVHQSDSAQDGYLPYVDIKAFETGQINSFTDGEKCIPCKAGDVLIVCDGARSGLVGRAMTGYVGSTLAKVTAEGLNNDYLFYFIQGKYALLNTKMKGTGTPHLNVEELKKQKLVIPEKEEQERIVSRIEELFSEIDKAEETLAQTRAQLVIYRQGILKHCIDRYRQGSKSCTIKDVCNDIKVGIVIKPAQYYTEKGKGIKAFRSANVREFYVNNAEWVYLTKEGHLSNHRSEVHTGDVLIVRSGYPGTACVVTEEYNGCNAIDILIATPDTSRILPEFLCLFTNSPYGKALVRKHKRGVAQAHLNVSGYSKLEIWVPTLEQQAQAVNMATAQISSCDAISKTIEQGLNQAHSLRQSILKKAFEGELV